MIIEFIAVILIYEIILSPNVVLVLGTKKWRMRLTFELTTTELVFWIHLQKAMLTGRATSVCTKHSLCTSKYV